MSATVETTALAVREEQTGELQTTTAESLAQHEIQGAIIVAQRCKRNEDVAYAAIIRSCQRPTFAADATYSFPRGGSMVTGPSVYLAREFARVWGNIRHGCHIIADDDKSRTIRAWAWDVQTNAKCEQDDTFQKMVQRKRDGRTQWVPADERDLRELTNRRAAIAKRNCILELLPSDMVEDALKQAADTVRNTAAKDPDASRKAIVKAFTGLNVPVAELEAHLGHQVSLCTPAEIVELQQIYKSINDGGFSWRDYYTPPSANADQVASKMAAKTQEAPRRFLSKPQQKRINDLVKQLGLNPQQVDGFLAKFQVDKVENLDTEQADELVRMLSAEADAGREPGE